MKNKITGILTLVCLAFLQACGNTSSDNNATSNQTATDFNSVVSFSSGTKQLEGYLFKPEGNGPFPAVIFNHGSESDPKEPMGLAQFYTGLGYVFFAPHRTGHGLSADAGISATEKIADLQDENMDPATRNEGFMAYQEEANVDVINALLWLKNQSFVDGSHMMVTGISYGGIQTLLTAKNAAGKNLALKAAVAFAPAAMSWNDYLAPLLGEVVETASVPLFIIQAENDYNLGPSQYLGPILESKGSPNRYKIYPAFGTTVEEGHGFGGGKGSSIWSTDVLAFLKDCGM